MKLAVKLILLYYEASINFQIIAHFIFVGYTYIS